MRAAAIVAIATLSLAAAACSTAPAPRQGDRSAASNSFSIAAPTERVRVEVGDIGRRTVIDGRITPRDATPVPSPVAGSVASLDVRQGDDVEVGDVVATIDLGPDAGAAILTYQLAVARRDLAAAQGEPTDALDEAVAAATEGLVELQLDPERFADLGLDDDPTTDTVGPLGSIGTVAVVADRSGVVVSTSTRFGNGVEVGDAIVVVGTPDDLVARGTASASQREVVRILAPVDVVPRDETLAPVSGVVGAAGETVTVDLDDPDALELGTRVSIAVRLETAVDVLWVPPSVVRGTGDERFVLVDRDGVQVRVEVELGLQTDDRTEILRPTDLGAGDLVVAP